MISIASLSGKSLRIAVLACYVIAIIAGGGLHIHVERAHADAHSESGHITLHAHSHVQHDDHNNPLWVEFAHPIHNHAVPEFQYTATRSKDASESLSSTGSTQQVGLRAPAEFSIASPCRKHYADHPRLSTTEWYASVSQPRAPPAA